MGAVVLFWFGVGKLGAGHRVGHDLQLPGGGAGRHPHSAALARNGFDPAVASGVFVTMVTDVVGFFAFLGLATLWLL